VEGLNPKLIRSKLAAYTRPDESSAKPPTKALDKAAERVTEA
jgi:hypothetical protein